ncbi:MAG: hypothetical protein BGO90_06180 [Legionella sp. 40-6]|nr:hypothetical protein [Legionella sp.]OJY38354.1 MAG: hypothetical protein BGO90_06180 [Legionella sp. 40-6]
MSNSRYIMFGSLWVLSLLVHGAPSDYPSKVFRNFWHPLYNGERLDFCAINGKNCGKEIADRYCQLLGYKYSNQYTIAYNIGLTHYLESRAKCTGWQCNGFMNISCVNLITHKPPQAYYYREQKFVAPRVNHYRVDWCYKKGNDCGESAAHSFCSRMGFMRAKNFTQENKVGATKALGDEALCFGPQCSAFKYIVCYR